MIRMKAICGKRRILIISFILFAVVMSFSILRYKHFHQTTPTEFNSKHWITHPRCRNRMVDDLVQQYRCQPMPFYGMTYDELTALLGTGKKYSTFDLTYTISDNFWEVTKYIGFNFDADGNCIYFDVVETGRSFDAASSESPLPPNEEFSVTQYISFLGKSAKQISDSTAIPFSQWNFIEWDGGSPCFDDTNGLLLYFDYSDLLEKGENTSNIILDEARICVRVDFPLSKIYPGISSVGIHCLEDEFGCTFTYGESDPGIGAFLDEKFLILIECGELAVFSKDSDISTDSYVCILDKRQVFPSPGTISAAEVVQNIDGCTAFIGKTGSEIAETLGVSETDWVYLDLVEGGHCFYFDGSDYIYTFSMDDLGLETPETPGGRAKCLIVRVPLGTLTSDTDWDTETYPGKIQAYFGKQFELDVHPLTGTRSLFAVDLENRLVFSIYETEDGQFNENSWVEISYINDSNYPFYSEGQIGGTK